MSTISREQLDSVWSALNAPPPKHSWFSAQRIMQRIADDGWMYSYQLEDLAYAADSRLVQHKHGVDLEALSKTRGYHWVSVMDRPRMRSINAAGFYALSATDAAAFFMELESLGFSIDPSALVNRLRPAISKKRLITNSELDIFWAPKMRHKLDITLEVEGDKWSLGETKRGKFQNGYRYEAWFNEDGSIHLLNVKGPKHRHRGRPVETKCAECGVTWWRGDPDSSAEHRAGHRKRMYAINPQPNPLMITAMASETEPELVTASSPKWKHFEIYRRASAFRREEGYDFVQWDSPEGDDDPHVQGFLLTSDEGLILGAIAFRWREPDDKTDPPFWGLQWVWICPRARHGGLLSSRWPFFRERFGEFYVEGPVSESLRSFLAKHGDEHLMKWPSHRAELADA